MVVSFNLADLNGSNGFILKGMEAGAGSESSVSGAGDINGDGLADVIIGAPRADPNGESDAGESYVVFGKSDGFDAAIDLAELDGSTGFVIRGIDRNNLFGASVSGAGDVNSDGLADLIIGAPRAAVGGQSYVVLGSSRGFPPSLELSALDGGKGFTINAASSSDQSGEAVSGAGDVNGDGIDDLIIGARYANPNNRIDAGESYVVFGSADGFAASLDLEDLDGINGFTLNGIDDRDHSGRSVSGAGDVNGDGIDDVIIGAPSAGESYVVFGSDAGFAASLDLADLDGTNGFVLNRIHELDGSGFSVSGAGDINGDGVDDLIIGAHLADPNGIDRAGESYVVFGSADGFAASLDLEDLDGINGFTLNGIDELSHSGMSVSGAGDVNGDGFDDLLIGALFADPNGTIFAGQSYVVFGSDQGFGASLELANLDGSNGFVLNGIDEVDLSGSSVSGAGDVNGDGFDDLIIGATGADSNGKNFIVESYVVFGSRDFGPPSESVPVKITFQMEAAGFDNAFGIYFKDTMKAELLAASLDATADGAVVYAAELTQAEIEQLGVFLLPNGNNANTDLAALVGDALTVVETDEGFAVSPGGPDEALGGSGAPALFSHAQMNPGGFDNVVEDGAPWHYQLFIEDKAGGGDRDFDDVQFQVEIGVPETDVSLEVIFEGENAGFRNTFGYFVEGTDQAGIIFADVDQRTLPVGTMETLDLAPEDYKKLAFFIVPDGYSLNQNLLDDPAALDLIVEEVAGRLQARDEISGQALQGFVNPVYVADGNNNPDGLRHALQTGTLKGYSLDWEDLPGGGDKDYDDVQIAVSVSQDAVLV